MKLITNNNGQTHLSVIKQLLSNSDEIIICVAFLKNSGLDFILDLLSGNCTFYVGTNYYLTEPVAIKKLLRNKHKVYLTEKKGGTFHPKIYFFRQGSKIFILTGSANLTGGGLNTNLEASVLIETEEGSSIYRQFDSAIKYFLNHSKLVESEFDLNQYEREFDTYRKKHKKADKEFNDELKQIHKLDLSQLNQFAEEYIKNKQYLFAQRVKNYKVAEELMDSITKANISSPSQFLKYYEEIVSYFHSSGLLRGKTIMAENFEAIISVIKIVQENKSAAPSDVFTKALPFVNSTKRFGVNALTEIMNAYNPDEFSVANGRTIKSLANLGFTKYPEANNFNADTYKDYNKLITEMAEKCKFKDLGQVDHFLSWYYEKYVKRNKSKSN